MNAAQFEAAYGHVADQLHKDTGLDRRLFLAQFALETGWGNSFLAKHNNLAGITYTDLTSGFGHNVGGFVTFINLDMFVKCYEIVLHLSYYKAVRDSARESLGQQISALGASPWAASHYGSPPGHNLLGFLHDFDPTPTPLPTPQPSGDFWFYEVKGGDTLSALAEKYLGNASLWSSIFNLNKDRIDNADLIFPGQEIRIPGKNPNVPAPPVTPPVTPPQPPAKEVTDSPTRGKYYVVKHGDSLWNIAVAAYGDGTQFHKIVAANHISNPNLIYAGNEFLIPE